MPGTRICLVTAVCALAAWGQSDSKTFYFPNVTTAPTLQEYVNVIRSVGDIKDATQDWEKKSITVKGTTEQISLAAWISQQLADAPSSRPSTVRRDYTATVAKTDQVTILFLAHATTPQALQELVNSTRSIADIQRFFPCNEAGAIVSRGTPEQTTLGAWMVQALDQPAGSVKPGHLDHPFPSDPRSNMAQIYVLRNNPATPRVLQEIVNSVRSVADIQRFFPYNAQNVIVMRGPAEQVALADWLLGQIDQPVGAVVSSQPLEYQYTDGPRGASVARVFFLRTADSPQKLQEIVNEVRTATHIQRFFPLAQITAIAARGTADQISQAEQLLKDR
jgi:hypothetical protein